MAKKTKSSKVGAKAEGLKSPSAHVVGRQNELNLMQQTLGLGRNLLIEGPVGVGKTFLVLQVLKELGLEHERVDGDTRYTEQKLTGWFDPPLVLQKGYSKDTFVAGPLVEAMEKGNILFINELNRLPEAVQNILLPAMDERRVVIPKIGAVVAKPGFAVVATQNPREFTATHALSEALLDRFEMLWLDYQTAEEELEILNDAHTPWKGKVTLDRILDLVRATRNHQALKRGASIRAGLALADLVAGGMSFKDAALIALPSRIELLSSEDNPRDIILELLEAGELPAFDEKKKIRPNR